jgi:hypothetical protein
MRTTRPPILWGPFGTHLSVSGKECIALGSVTINSNKAQRLTLLHSAYLAPFTKSMS